jgi:hypothetical protein
VKIDECTRVFAAALEAIEDDVRVDGDHNAIGIAVVGD